MKPGNAPRVRARPRGGPSASPDDDATYYYFTIDDHLLYLSFFQDWGPLNIAMVYKACILIHELLEVCVYCGASVPGTETVARRIKTLLRIGWFSTRQTTHGGKRMLHF
jgi:hypothetical protein